MFSDAINALIDGHIICRVTKPDLFDYLAEKSHRDRVSSYLQQIGWRVVSTHNQSGYFLVPHRPGEDTKSALNSMHKKIMGDVRPMIEFLTLCLAATQSDSVLRPGDHIPETKFAALIDESAKRRTDLQSLYARLIRGGGKTNTTEMLRAVLRALEQRGYLVEHGPSRELFVATGMVDAFHDLVDFLVENTPGAEETLDEPEVQGALL
ncbi:DUF4194 domain-containing protein [Tateyamaria pelophila]|uniref:DUF4194 domain-containing protein n=1 Tax=Tateyamaria pelophila TaxID=328415 RepID=UPI001CBCF19D|nr:DUF4194 domain-containing protein [Tateyamaria pelophila]